MFMTAIVAVDRNWGIGRGDSLLFRISSDMKRFRRITLGKTVVMGHATFMTLPKKKPLDRRDNIVLSRNTELTIDGAAVVHSLSELCAKIAGKCCEDIFVIGGESVYRQLLPYTRRVHVTKIYETVAGADKFFPDLDRISGWSCEPESGIIEEGGLKFQYFDYTYRPPEEI